MHVQMPYQSPLRKEICRQLNTASEPRPHNGCSHPSVETTDTLGAMDFPKAVQCIFVPVLGANWKERREGLQACLDEEEGRAGSSA